eukprot:TRINITY_DN9266_c0_g1_i1.p1 TRINITY_DN9266_c0_g1~~TRINITY_DN9266_c0_g1_i1.p1  ORF type:complete len:412 (-),score=78.84 TRINITY_DN9266_c0_g1_i1:361-1596(-)
MGDTRINLQIVYLIVVVDLIGVAMVGPLISGLYRTLNTGPLLNGVVSSTYGFMQFVFAPAMGHLSDLYGRKRILLISFIGSALSYLMLGAATSVWVLLLSRMLVGAVKQTVTVAEALITDGTVAVERMKAFSRLRTAMSVSFIIGPLIGGVVTQALGLWYMSLLAPLVFVADFVLVWTCLPYGAPRLAPSKATSFSSLVGDQFVFLKRLVANAAGARLLFARFGLHFALQMNRSGNTVFLLDRLGVQPADTAYITAYNGCIGVVMTAIVLPMLAKAVSEKLMLIFGAAVLIVAHLATSVTYSLSSYLVILPFESLAHFAVSTCLMTLFSRAFDASDVGAAMGIGGSVRSVAAVLAPLMCGILQHQFGLASPFVVSSVMVAVVVVSSLPLFRAASSVAALVTEPVVSPSVKK